MLPNVPIKEYLSEVSITFSEASIDLLISVY